MEDRFTNFELYKQGDFYSSFAKIYCLSCLGDAEAEYIIGEYYELGLGEITKSPKEAAEYYTRSILHSKNCPNIKLKAEAGLIRIINSSENVKSNVNVSIYENVKNNLIISLENKSKIKNKLE